MKKTIIFILFAMTFLLVSCWDSEEEKGLSLKQYTDFEISIPTSWIVIDTKDSSIPKPSYWEVSLIASSPEPKDGFSNNIIILKDKINKDITSKDFSIFTNLWAKDEYNSYKEIESKDLVFNDEEESKVYIFEARYSSTTPKLRFLQTAHICDKASYLLTVALSSSIIDSSKYEDIIKSFKCNNENTK